CIIASGSSIQRHRYFEFAPGRDAEPNADLDTLADAVGDAVLKSLEQCHRISSDPVVTLSGGADSRLVLAGLLEIGAKNIRTITWGSENQYRSGDGFVAAQLARRCGVEHRFAPQTNDFLTMPAFTRRFGAETDVAAYHIGELSFVQGMLSDGGSRSLYRGDECFGWLGAVHTADQAATAVGVRPMQALRTNLEPVFAPRAYAAVCDAHGDALADEVQQATPMDFVDLKDRHYFYLRLARYLQPVNAYKLSCVETFNPLLAKPVLECLATVPSRLRLNKQVELRLLARRFPRVMTIPFATRASLADSGHAWQTTPAVRSFVHATLGRTNNLWNQLFDPVTIEAFASTCLRNGPWRGAPIRRWAARILRGTGLYTRARRHTWNPTTHAQPSLLRLLQRLTVMKLWIDTHEGQLTLDLG
ncbi:MAG: hypothetical protein JXA69_06155, partial [Phycisphaerae bacterium]|nr:hypothetical protein [Phycisphaerae bacterium]